jgi:hypothetical protein
MYQIVSHTPTIATFSMYFLAMVDFELLQESRDQELIGDLSILQFWTILSHSYMKSRLGKSDLNPLF